MSTKASIMDFRDRSPLVGQAARLYRQIQDTLHGDVWQSSDADKRSAGHKVMACCSFSLHDPGLDTWDGWDYIPLIDYHDKLNFLSTENS